jgi:hypothetical protein
MICDMNSAKLYALKGSTFICNTTVVTSDEPSKTSHWHAHLDHMSEHGMTELIKRELLHGCNMSMLEFCEH